MLGHPTGGGELVPRAPGHPTRGGELVPRAPGHPTGGGRGAARYTESNATPRTGCVQQLRFIPLWYSPMVLF